MTQYQFKEGISCSKCHSTNVKLRDNMYYANLAKATGIILCLTVIGIPFGIACFIEAKVKKNQPIGMVECENCGKTKNYKKGELYNYFT